MDTPHPFSLIALPVSIIAILGLMIVFSMVTEQADTMQCHQSSECVKFLNDNYASEGQLNKTVNNFMDAAGNNFALIIALDEKIDIRTGDDSTIAKEIFKNKEQIRLNHPATITGEQAPEKKTGEAATAKDTPTLTIKLDKEEYIAGATIEITGNANPGKSVQLWLQSPGQKDYRESGHSAANQNGEFILYWFSSLDQEPGDYRMKITSQNTNSSSVKLQVIE